MIRSCPACGAKNRVPARHLADRGRCGACKAELPPVSEPLVVDAAHFDDVVGNARVPVLVDFWASWCGPCRMAAPEVARVAAKMAGEALVLKVDTEANPDLASRFRIRGIPHFMVFRDGAVSFQQSGLVRAEQMQEWLRNARAA